MLPFTTSTAAQSRLSDSLGCSKSCQKCPVRYITGFYARLRKEVTSQKFEFSGTARFSAGCGHFRVKAVSIYNERPQLVARNRRGGIFDYERLQFLPVW